jgi:hypothetical protein
VASRPSGVGGPLGEARVGIKAAARPQADEDLAWRALDSLLELQRIVPSVEDEQRDGAALPRGSTKQGFDLLGGESIDFPIRMEARYVYWGRPTLADEVELGDELVGPSGHDGLSGGVTRRVVVVAALWAALGVASGPYAHVHGVDGMFILASGERMTGEQPPQGLGVYPTPV